MYIDEVMEASVLKDSFEKAITRIYNSEIANSWMFSGTVEATKETQKRKDEADIRNTEVRKSVFTPEEARCEYGACRGKEKGMVREYPINLDSVELKPISPGSIFYKRDFWTGEFEYVSSVFIEVMKICDGCIEEMEKQIPKSQYALLNFGESWTSHINIRRW